MKASQAIRITLDNGLYTANWKGNEFFCHALSEACRTGIITHIGASDAKDAVMNAMGGQFTLAGYLNDTDKDYLYVSNKYGHWHALPYNRRVKWLRRLALTLESQGN